MKRILVVEDAELNVDLLVQLLEDEYKVLTAKRWRGRDRAGRAGTA
jgi:CheY-like chemotaxis protein